MKENIEYTKMAEYYDLFYHKKNYEKEVSFIEAVINNPGCSILDAGCGTGNHLFVLRKRGYNVRGFDINDKMLTVANRKMPDCCEQGDLLNYQTNQKFDGIISFFAVFNHLNGYKMFFQAVENLKTMLKQGGKLIIDLHNPQKSGCKQEQFDGFEREMKWRVCKLLSKEYSIITYKIKDEVFKTKHIFSIFKLNKLKKGLKAKGYNCNFYENYDLNKPATTKSKNIQIVIKT